MYSVSPSLEQRQFLKPVGLILNLNFLLLCFLDFNFLTTNWFLFDCVGHTIPLSHIFYHAEENRGVRYLEIRGREYWITKSCAGSSYLCQTCWYILIPVAICDARNGDPHALHSRNAKRRWQHRYGWPAGSLGRRPHVRYGSQSRDWARWEFFSYPTLPCFVHVFVLIAADEPDALGFILASGDFWNERRRLHGFFFVT